MALRRQTFSFGMRSAPRPAAAAAAGLVGLIAIGACVLLAGRERAASFVPLPAWVPAVMAAGGAVILLIAIGGRGGTVVRNGLCALALSMLAYPVLLGAARASAAGTSGAVADSVLALAMTGHLLPLVLIQLLPVLAMRALSGRPRRWVPVAIVVGNAVDVALQFVAGTLAPGPAVHAVAIALWVGTAVLAPVATWTAVARTSGEVRHRAVLIAIASTVSPLILGLCVVLGLTEQIQRSGAEASVAMLMLGLAAAALGTASLVATGLGRPAGRWLHTRVLGAVLAGALAAGVALLAAAAVLFGAGAGLDGVEAVFVALAVGIAAIVAGTRLHRWTVRIVDPVAELRADLDATGTLTDGTLRDRMELALRRAAGDARLRLLVVVPLDAAARLGREAHVVPLTPPTDDPGVLAVLAVASTASSARRLRALGDVSAFMWAVVLETEVARERERADAAARLERDRLSRNLHDGLQSRLLGIALNLQLESARQSDPTTRALIGETVAALRGAAEEARGLADGLVPAALQQGGLGEAVDRLVGSLGSVVAVDIPARRFPPAVEEAGFYVVGEAVGNAIKHAGAASIAVQVRSDDDARALLVTVTDDGVGGADPRAGSGLRRLGERVAASGGILTVREAQPRGTIVEAALPCGS